MVDPYPRAVPLAEPAANANALPGQYVQGTAFGFKYFDVGYAYRDGQVTAPVPSEIEIDGISIHTWSGSVKRVPRR